MKTFFYKYLIGIVWLILWGTGGFVTAEPPETDDNGIPIIYYAPYYVREDAAKMYRYLRVHGDYSKLKLIVRTNKNEYDGTEPVYLRFYVRNDSDGEVYLRTRCIRLLCIFLGRVINSQKEDVPYTLYAKRAFKEFTESSLKKEDIVNRAIYWSEVSTGNPNARVYQFCKLQPGQEFYLDSEIILPQYFDLTLPGKYELTYFQKNFMNGQKYGPPLQSNTVKFTILDRHRFFSGNIADNNFENPEPGKEVFEQKEEPKNIFFWEYTDTKYEIIDISPETFYKQRAEKEATKRKEADKKE